MAKRQYANVCQIRVPIGMPISYGGGHIAPTARHLGMYAPVSKPTAKKLAAAIGVRVPRPGWEVTLCKDTYLANMSGSFQVERRASGEFQGVKRKRRR